MKRQYRYLNTDGPGRALFDPGLGDKTRRRRRCVDDTTYAEKSAANSAMKYAYGEGNEQRCRGRRKRRRGVVEGLFESSDEWTRQGGIGGWNAARDQGGGWERVASKRGNAELS